MYRLIHSDLILNRRVLVILAPMLVAFLVVLCRIVERPAVYTILVSGYALLLPMAFLSREDQFGASALFCSLPLSRATLVRARYLASWILLPLYLVAGFGIYTLFSGQADVRIWTVGNVMLAATWYTMCSAVLLPFLVRFGRAGFLWLMIVISVSGVCFQFLVTVCWPDGSLKEYVQALTVAIGEWSARSGRAVFYGSLLAILVAVNWLSCTIATAVFKRREL